MNSKTVACIAAFLALTSICHAQWIREVEISSEDETDGQKDYTVRIMPGKTHKCDKIVFECIYQQQFPWVNMRGEKCTKTHEPVRFVYRRKSVKLVNDLDQYASFRVPVSKERLARAYGPKTFNKDYPVIVARIKITGTVGRKSKWSFEVKADGKHDIAELIKKAAREEDEDDEELGDLEGLD